MSASGEAPGHSPIGELNAEQQEQLSVLLDDYFNSLERGTPLTRAELAARCSTELLPFLDEYLASIEFLQGAAVGFRPAPSAGEGTEEGESDPLVARQLGDYKIVREVGRGGMGVVYEAWQESLQRRVALKVLPFAALLDAQQIARFRHEAQAAAQLQHPHIVPVFAVGVEQGVHYYAMQFIDGMSLDRVVAELRRASTKKSRGEVAEPGRVRSVVELFVQAAEALQAAHEAGVIHRDIKPSNLLLDGNHHLWVTDFGLARHRGNQELTRPGDLVGTMRYMSPEQARGPSHLVDARTDIYSLGTTLYELLTLQPAVRGENAAQLLQQLEHGRPYSPRSWNPAISFDLETILLKAIAHAPEERYSSAREFADDLRRYLQGHPIVARRPTLVDRTAKFAWRHRVAVALVLVATATILVGLSVTTAIMARQQSRLELALRSSRESFKLYRDQLAASHNNLAMLHEQQGDRSEAERWYREALRLYRESLLDAPDNSSARRAFAGTLGNLAVLLATTDAAEAGQLFAEAVQVQQELAEQLPDDRNRQAELALTLSNQGAFWSGQGRLDLAVHALERAIDILDPLLEVGPGDRAVARDLAVTLNNLGMTQQRLNRLEDAEKSFRRATQILPGQQDGDGQRVADLSRRGGIYNNLGLVLERQGRSVEAVHAFDEAIRWQEQACREAPRVERFQQLLEQHQKNRQKVDNSEDPHASSTIN